MKKLIKALIKLIIIILVLAVIYFVASGYIMYLSCFEKNTLSDKINAIRAENDYVQLKDMPEYYYNAVVAIEDKRFFEHGPIDIKSILRAIVVNMKDMNFTEGGSSITQQLAKNLYFSQEKKLERKVAEVFMAYDLEKKYKKEEILELYINVIYYGDGYYGLYDASYGYFNKHPKDLTLYEATLLAGVPNAPSIYAISNGNPYIYKRQEDVVNCMIEAGYITDSQANLVLKNKGE